MDELPKVSIVVPCYADGGPTCHSKYLAYALSGISLQQQPYEVIVVDDGSPAKGKVMEVVDSVRAWCPVRCIVYDENLGLGGARNVAIREATGDYILPLDADDALSRCAVDTLRAALIRRPTAAVAYGDVIDIDTRRPIRWVPKQYVCDYSVHAFVERNPLSYSSMFTKKAWEAVGGYDETRPLHEDWDFWLSLAIKGFEFVHVPHNTLLYRQTLNKLSIQCKIDRSRIFAYMRKKYHFLGQTETRCFVPNWETPVDTLLGAKVANTKTTWIDISNIAGKIGREDCQRYWQEWVGQLFSKVRILDVGSGLGLSRGRLAAGGNVVELQEPAPDLPADYKQDISELPDKNWDIVTSFDVIEHVIEDEKFLANLVRLARRYVIFTTPNYNINQAVHQFHCREYTPTQILKLVEPYRIAQLGAGISDGSNFSVLRRAQFENHMHYHHCVILHTN